MRPSEGAPDPELELFRRLTMRILEAAPTPVEEDRLIEAMAWAEKAIDERVLLDLVLDGRVLLTFDAAGEMRFEEAGRKP